MFVTNRTGYNGGGYILELYEHDFIQTVNNANSRKYVLTVVSTIGIAPNQLYYGHMEAQAGPNHSISGTNLDAAGMAAQDNIYRLQNLSIKSVTSF